MEKKELEPVKLDEYGETEIYNMDEKQSLQDHEHEFRRTVSNECQCQCGWGLYLFPSDELRDGHIYRTGQLIV